MKWSLMIKNVLKREHYHQRGHYSVIYGDLHVKDIYDYGVVWVTAEERDLLEAFRLLL